MSCPFCHMPNEKIVLENRLAKAFFDKFPVQEGHLLIVPKRHVPSYFEATEEEIMAIYQLIHKGKEIIDQQYQPDGYNIGVNIWRTDRHAFACPSYPPVQRGYGGSTEKLAICWK